MTLLAISPLAAGVDDAFLIRFRAKVGKRCVIHQQHHDVGGVDGLVDFGELKVVSTLKPWPRRHHT